jgi:hypothetical protein
MMDVRSSSVTELVRTPPSASSLVGTDEQWFR